MTVLDYVERLAEKSKIVQHEAVEECLDYVCLAGTCELTLEQVAVFWDTFCSR